MVGTPVVVHAACPVTRHHVEQSRGGLYCSSMQDLAGVTRYFLEQEGARDRHAAAGAEYVRTEYSWVSVLKRFDAVVEGLLSNDSSEERIHE